MKGRADNINEVDVVEDMSGKVALEPSRKFKLGWFIAIVGVIAFIGVGVFLLTSKVNKVDSNTEAIDRACVVRNEQIAVVNEKFAQLVTLFDASLADRRPGEPPPTEEILKLYDVFRQPIKNVDCRA